MLEGQVTMLRVDLLKCLGKRLYIIDCSYSRQFAYCPARRCIASRICGVAKVRRV